MDFIVKYLHEHNCTLVMKRADYLGCFYDRGVLDLYKLFKDNALHDSLIADKVVGKAAAALMILGGTKEFYTDVISEQALQLLEESNIKISFGERVPYIINRVKNGWCPLETRCKDCKTAEECLAQIESFMNEQQ